MTDFQPPCTQRPEVFDAVLDHETGPEHRRAVAATVAICATCPLDVRLQCLRDNYDHPSVIAGLTWAARNPKKKPTKHPTCGKPHGIDAHRRNHEHTCDACKEANRKKQRGLVERQPAKCGTDSGYKKHRRAGETPCDACKKAHSLAERRRTKKRREAARAKSRRKPNRRTLWRVEALRDLIATGAGMDEVCTRLGLTQKALYKWCYRHGFTDEWAALSPPKPEALVRVRRRDAA